MAKTNIKALLKKGLTGEEIGRLVVKDCIESYKSFLLKYNQNSEKILNNPSITKDISIFTQAERDAMVNSLNTNEDIKDYNNYRALVNYIQKLAQRNLISNLSIEVAFQKLTAMIREFQAIEKTRLSINREPIIMTEKQYKEFKEKNYKERISHTYSISDIILDIISFNFNEHNKGNKNKYSHLFEKYKKEEITDKHKINKLINLWGHGYYETPDGKKREEFTEEEWENLILTTAREYETETGEKYLKWVECNEITEEEPVTKFDLLENEEEFYFLDTGEADIKPLKEDFPDLIELAIEDLKEIKGLKNIKKIPIEEYNYKKISIKHLIEADIGYYKEFVNESGESRGIAIIKETNLLTNIDENGYYKKNTLIEEEVVEKVVEGMEHIIKDIIEDLETSIIDSLAENEVFNVIAKRIDIPEIKILIDPFPKRRLELYNEFVDHLLDRLGIRSDKKNENIVSKAFPKIVLRELRPKKANIKKVKQTIEDMSTFKKEIDLVDIITGRA